MQRITDIERSCPCGWSGTVGEMDPDVDGEGSLGCPECGVVIVVTVPKLKDGELN